MASLLALSMLWILPSSHPQWSLAWVAPLAVPRPSGATQRARWGNNHQLPTSLLLASNSQTAVANNESVESLHHLKVPELKERLRSMGQKVTGNKSELIQRLTIHQQSISSDGPPNNIIDDLAGNKPDLDPSLIQLPDPVIEAFIRYASSSASSASSSFATSPKLLPIQQKSYQIIAEGQDAVLFSPTSSGKTLSFILPLAARLYGWKHDGSFDHKKRAQKKRFIMQQQRRNSNDSLASQTGSVEAATPSILVVEPSRELARQVGKVWSKFHPTAAKSSRRHVVTVYGGVPMERHAAMLGSKTDVVIGTPGRIRELIREKYLSTSAIRSIVLDEADALLNFKDNPEVEWLLGGMSDDYQLVLASATVNERVEKFVGEVMELEVGEDGYVVVDERDYGAAAADTAFSDGGIDIDGLSTIGDGAQVDGIDSNSDRDGDNNSNGERNSAPSKPSHKKPGVHHWSMAASAASRTTLTSDLIVTIAPRRGIIFVPSKVEVEVVAQELTERLSTANDVSIHILHGDMAQAARSRTINSFRGDTTAASSRMTRILVATDVASRGLDLPAVDLALQYGVPRVNGKDGTYDSELYIHRTGRAGRLGNTRDSVDVILLYDRSQGEGTTLSKLQEEMKSLQGIEIMPRKVPSPSEVMEASYERAFRRCEEFGGRGEGTQSLVQYFVERLSKDLNNISDDDSESLEKVGANEKEKILMHRLATAMAALSGLQEAVPPRSLLTSDSRDRTIRVWRDVDDSSNIDPLSPREVTKVVKSLGSGKLGRISICSDGSAVFDLLARRAELLLKNVAVAASSDDDASSEIDGWNFEMPSSLSSMPV